MKKIFTLFSLLVAALALQSQVVLNENFSNAFPPEGWSIDAHAANWSASPSSYAGGAAPEAYFFYSPDFNGQSRLISPVIDLTGQSSVLLQFNHYVDHYDGSYNIGVATRSNGGAWSTVWEILVNATIPPTTVLVPISDANTGSSTFQFCIYFSGNSYNLNWWSVDDISLRIPYSLDAGVYSLTTPTYFTGSEAITGSIVNYGTTNINSLKLTWRLDDGEDHTDILTGLNLGLGQMLSYTATDKVTPTPGVHTLVVFVSAVNGTTGEDDYPFNDKISKLIRIPTQTLLRKPFFEEFTSSTCGPCASFNNGTFNPFLAAHEDELVYVKYQMDWPGNGDPYYTEEGGVRKDYYGVAFVPLLVTEGKTVPTNSQGVNTAFDEGINNPAFVDLSAYYFIDGNNVTVKGQILSYADLVNVTLHIVVFENVTHENVATNGETEFHHVMMKMLPDAYGTTIPEILTSEPYSFEQTVDMTGTFVEEMDDLSVAVFLQDNSNKMVFQSEYAYLSGVGTDNISAGNLQIYPNPAKEVINFNIPEFLGKTVQLDITTTSGKIVRSMQIPAGSYTLQNDLPAGLYIARITGEGGQFTSRFSCVK